MKPTLQTLDDLPLPFIEHNPQNPTTLVLIHGALSSPTELNLILPHLQQYHILLPAHHRGPRTQKFSIESTATQIATLIQCQAKHGVAHIFGFSLGSLIALRLATDHPDRVERVIVSGITLFSHFPAWKVSLVPGVLYAQSVLPRRVLSKGLQATLVNRTVRPACADHAVETVEEPLVGDWALAREVAATMAAALPQGMDIVVRTPVLVVAATCAEVGFPDPIADARLVLTELKRHCRGCRGVEVFRGSHPWVVQLPELCALLIRSWIEDTQFPEGVREIEIQ